MQALTIVLAAFLASFVEFVEAFTIVLAVGTTRSWRAALAGAAAAVALLALLLAAFGAGLGQRIDEHVLLLVIGVLLLLFGGRWLRKAILRAGGVVAHHDEDLVYREEVAALRAAGKSARFDWVSFLVSGKGTFLEGLEVAFVVLTLGATQGGYLAPSLGAAAAFVVVAVVGAAVRRPLAQVPENALKFAVGALLCTFGVYWTAEGLGVEWAGGVLALGYLMAAMLGVSWLAVRWLRRQARVADEAVAA